MVRVSTLLLSLCCVATSAFATHAVIFGDSLSDEGRLYALTHNTFPVAPYDQGRFSNGQLWTEYAFTDRENYAFAGAESGRDNVLDTEFGTLVNNTGLLAQVDEYLATSPTNVAQNAYYIEIGGDDLLAASSNDPDFMLTVKHIVDHVKLAAKRLEQAGATNITVVGLPNMSISPRAQSLPAYDQLALTFLTYQLNYSLNNLAEQNGLNYYDMNDFVMKLVKDPGAYGLANVEEACFNEVSRQVCVNPNEYLFWDDIHPTSRVHQLFAQAITTP